LIVLDASVVVDLLLDLPPHARTIGERVLAEAPGLAAPHLLDAEVGQVLRRLVRAGSVDVATALLVLADLADLPIDRFAHGPLLPRAFELRKDATVYDALYLTLDEALDVPLLTRDAALARATGTRARVELIR
jgi:predicted nucleic acid-binding protein